MAVQGGLVRTDVPGGGLLWEYHGRSAPPPAYFVLCIPFGGFHGGTFPPDADFWARYPSCFDNSLDDAGIIPDWPDEDNVGPVQGGLVRTDVPG
jgi:hypothetical protein